MYCVMKLCANKQLFRVFCWINMNEALVFDDQTRVFDEVFYRVWKPIHVTEWDDLMREGNEKGKIFYTFLVKFTVRVIDGFFCIDY